MEMHFPAAGEDSTAMAGLMWSVYGENPEEACEKIMVTSTPVVDEPAPQPAKPFNYLIIAAVGMGFGVALTPFAESWYRRFVSKD